MLRHTKYLGISMTLRRNRRLLVFLIYAAFVALIAVHAKRHAIAGFQDLGFLVMLGMMLTGKFAFGYLVPMYPFSRNAATVSTVPEVKSLMHPERNAKFRDEERDPEPPDEREIVVRNRAYYLAFNVILAYSLAVWCAGALLTDARFVDQTTAAWGAYAFLPVVVMALTLPQAIILWSEPDVIEEPA